MNDPRYYKRTIIKEPIHSSALGEQRDIIIYLPPGYSESQSYRALFCQDGSDFFTFGRVATIANRLILDEGVEPFIIVGVDVDKAKRTAEYDPRGEHFDAYCHFFAEELLPFIEQRYPARSSADARVIAGDSLGGTVSLHLALDYPDLFTHVMSLSGAFGPTTAQRLSAIRDLSYLHLYQLIGLDETAVVTDSGTYDFLRINRDIAFLLRGKNKSLQPNIVYLEKPGTHLWGFWQNELPSALHHFFGAAHGQTPLTSI